MKHVRRHTGPVRVLVAALRRHEPLDVTGLRFSGHASVCINIVLPAPEPRFKRAIESTMIAMLPHFRAIAFIITSKFETYSGPIATKFISPQSPSHHHV